jgi:uncharacterized iron-regulated membrane protein
MSIRKAVFWTHLVVGLVVGLFVAYMAATGSLLALQPLVTRVVERRLVTASAVPSTNCVTPSQIMLTAQRQSGRAIGSLQLFADRSLPTQIEFGRESVLLADTCSGRILSSGASRLRAFFLVVRNLHESAALGHTRGGILRNVKNAANLGFFFLLLSGLFLWMPRKWKKPNLRAATMLRTSLRGRARDWNLHNVAGFWLAPPLLAMSLTGAMMSYSWADRALYRISGTPAPPPHDEEHNQETRQREPALAASAVGPALPVERLIPAKSGSTATSSSGITTLSSTSLTAPKRTNPAADTHGLGDGTPAGMNRADRGPHAIQDDASPRSVPGHADLTGEGSGTARSVLQRPDEALEGAVHSDAARRGDHAGFEHMHPSGELHHHDGIGRGDGTAFSHHEPDSSDQGQHLTADVPITGSSDPGPPYNEGHTPQPGTERPQLRGESRSNSPMKNPTLRQLPSVIVTATPQVNTTQGAHNEKSDALTGFRPQHGRARRHEGPSRVLSAAELVSLDPLVERAKAQFPKWHSLRMRLPANGDQTISFTFDDGEDDGGGVQRSELVLNRTTGAVIEWVPFYQTSRGQRWRTYVRSLHTGELFGYLGQTIAFLAAMAALLLVWTGIALAARRFSAWRTRRSRAISKDATELKTRLGASSTNSTA